ncbi:peptidase [Methyloligella sp. 2.7D]|uniref:peptidase n=1 Tax=unclassified Methyloligella TaxID=2625955 RepID=UPI00157C6EA7|nr:peptidase [Methyloligella sp. GL2]QKP78390.1 peptidase [Methyloligella sp. GL2]
MTYCVGILLDDGIVLASDSRTNAGIDRVSTFRKMHVFEKPGERFFAVLTAGNLSLTQGVISLIDEWLGCEDPERDLWAVDSMFGAARVMGKAMREMHTIDDPHMLQAQVDYSASILLAGQVKGGKLRLFMVYDAGNFIEAMGDTCYFQIGEVKYGKPILDRILNPKSSLDDAVKCALISFDSTMRSNVSVGPPIDILIYRRDSFEPAFTERLDQNDPYLQSIHEKWGKAILEAFGHIEDEPGWKY